MSNNKVTRSRKGIAALGALVFVGAIGAAAASAGDNNQTAGEAVAAPTTLAEIATYEAPSSTWLDEHTTKAPAVAAGPFTTGSGTWFVPSDIQPGTYRAYSTRESGLAAGTGYYAVCADAACEIDMDGSDYTGLIDNGNLDGGPGLVVIPEHAATVQLSGVRLEAL